jgi:uncharacterized Tic20 family protein
MASSDGPFQYPPPDPSHAAPRPVGRAVASLVTGIIGLLIFGIILGPIAIWLGVSAKNDPAQGGEGMARAGIVLGIIDVAAFFISILFLL